MKVLLKFFNLMCRAYTVTAVLFLLLNMAVAGNADNTVIRPDAFLLILPFAAGYALASVIYAIEKLPHALRLTAHFAIITLCAYLLLYLPAGTGASTGMKFLILLIIALLYWLCMGIWLALRAARAKTKPAETQYTNLFKR